MEDDQNDNFNGYISENVYFVPKIVVHFIISNTNCLIMEKMKLLNYYYFCREGFFGKISNSEIFFC